MKIHFYGTGASEGVPSMFCDCLACNEARRLGGKNIRTRSSCAINDNLLIDFSCDTFAHTVWGGLDLRKIDNFLITHAHKDHLYPHDLVNMAPPMAQRIRNDIIHLYGTKEAVEIIQRVFSKETRGIIPATAEVLAPGKETSVGPYQVIPIKTKHAADIDCYIYIIKHEGKTLLYGHDSTMYPEDAWQYILREKYDCVIMDCTSVLSSHVFSSHMGFDENVAVRNRLIGNGCATNSTLFIATHFVHTYNPLHDRIAPIFAKDGIIPAFDGFEVDI
ncbi:MAG: hypothetical protein IJ214_01335 [Clostridia bacterium]|nr:hypothetical protein [Clostridia bacterium]